MILPEAPIGHKPPSGTTAPARVNLTLAGRESTCQCYTAPGPAPGPGRVTLAAALSRNWPAKADDVAAAPSLAEQAEDRPVHQGAERQIGPISLGGTRRRRGCLYLTW
jgi:hypothetical protein